MTDKINIPSLIKWSGGKRNIASKIIEYFPKKVENYYEPFLGGASMLYLVRKIYPNCKVYGSDVYSPLVDLFKNIQKNPENVINNYYFNWQRLQKNFPEYYYEIRKSFNEKNDYNKLLFLSRTCTNGIIRFNEKGHFNNSLHLSRRGMKPKNFEKIVIEWSKLIKKNSQFLCCDYSKIINKISKNSLIYLDPPYYHSKNRYSQNLEIDKFYLFLKKLNEKKIKFILSFDGRRGDKVYEHLVPKELYLKKINIDAGKSNLSNVLNNKKLKVIESLYFNY